MTRLDSARPVVHGMMVYIAKALLSNAVMFLDTTLPVKVNVLLAPTARSKLSVLTCPSINVPPKRIAFVGRISVTTILFNGNVPVLDTTIVYDTNDHDRSVVHRFADHIFVIVTPCDTV